MRSVLQHTPSVLPCPALILPSGGTPIWIRDSDTTWSCHPVYDGVFHGECLSSAAFCLCLHTAIQHFRDSLPTHLLPLIYILAYIDDVTLVMPPNTLHIIWPLWQAALATAKLNVEPTKCQAWIPTPRKLTR